MKKIPINKNFVFLILLTILSLIFSIYISKKSQELGSYNLKFKNLEKVIHQKEIIAESVLSNIASNIKKTNTLSFKNIANKYNSEFYKQKGIAIFIYRNDSLLFWSDNNITVDDNYIEAYQNGNYIQLSNGNYLCKRVLENSYTIIALILIKTEYKYNNDYLINKFQDDFDIDENFSISNNYSGYNIYNNSGKYLFSINANASIEKKRANKYRNLACFLYLLTTIFFFICLIKLHRFLMYYYKTSIITIIFIFLFILLRFIVFYFKIPSVVYNSFLFGPTIYASSEWLPSFGDFIINIFLITFLSIFIYKNININPIQIKLKRGWRFLLSIFISLFPLFLSNIVVYLITSLIINSNISFNINNIFELSGNSYFSFVLIGFILLSSFLVIEKTGRYVVLRLVNLKEFIIIMLISLLIYVLSCIFFLKLDILYFFPFLLIYIIVIFNSSKFKKSINVSTITIYLILLTFFTNVVLYKTNDYKEKEKRKTIALRLSKKGDPIGEYLFGEINEKIKNDKRIIKCIKRETVDESDLSNLIQNYFSGYWAKYDLQITFCKKTDNLIIKPDELEVDCYTYFNNKIKLNIGKPTNYYNFFNVNTNNGRNSYIAVFSFRPTKYDTLIPYSKIFVELDSKFIPKELGYPELLIDNKVNIFRDYGNYSYAKYYNNEQLLQFGSFFYSLNSSYYNDNVIESEFRFFSKDGYDHLLYKTANTTIIVSKKTDNIFNIISPFSYLFAFNFILLVFISFLMNIPIDLRKLKFNFKNRVQLSMISVVLVSFIFIGGGTIYYIINLYNNKNLDNISEKTHSVLVEIERNLVENKVLTKDMSDYLSDQLIRYSNIFFTDVNLYDLKGNLLASSQPKIFEEGLISKKMNLEAYLQLKYNNKNLFVHDENIGNLKYLSAYIPFRNYENEIIAYLNLPYFAKQSELKKEISSFLVKFINIYVLLIALAILIALFISNRITKPLRLIRDNISRIMLGKSNEKIKWTKKDEIGILIKEYNRMIDELEKSAELLAKSERESAWREMAKQVAHEIKNPLTPMKLSVQYLLKSWNEKAENWDIRLEKFSKTMVEQIDALSAIATEFSNFAKLPKSNKEKIELFDFIQNVIELFNNNYDNITFDFFKEKNQTYFVYADSKQLLSVFNNLIKNAVQAIDNKKMGKIQCNIIKNNHLITVTIADNGSGISENQKNKIFSPNFTTKSSGMGLGLAMVKNIIESVNGTISFHSIEGIGTTFVIVFPEYEMLIKS